MIEAMIFLALIPSFFVGSNSLSLLMSLALFPCVVSTYFFSRSADYTKALPFWIAAVVVISLASAVWSLTPRSTLVNAIRGTLPMVNIMLLIGLLPFERVWQLVKGIIGLSIVGSLIAVAILPSAVHGASDSLIAGSWRGLYHHKNGAGPAGAVAVLIFVDSWRRQRGILNLILAVSAVVFLIGTQSKTSIILTGFSFFVLYFLRRWYRGGVGRMLVAVICLFTLCAVGILLVDENIRILLFDNPYNFTGRVGIWKTALSIWWEQPWLGYGFRSVFGSENYSILGAAVTPFAAIAPHPHNSYIQALVGTGIVGLGLVLIAFVISPIVKALRLKGTDIPPEISLCLTIIVFSIARALFESLVLQYARPGWIIWPICIALILNYSNQLSAAKGNS